MIEGWEFFIEAAKGAGYTFLRIFLTRYWLRDELERMYAELETLEVRLSRIETALSANLIQKGISSEI